MNPQASLRRTKQRQFYRIIDKVLDVPLQNSDYPGYFIGAFKTCVGGRTAEHALIYSKAIDKIEDSPLVRINSACFTGDIFGDRRCDCAEQLHMAMEMIRDRGGLIIYHLHHEGRGLGLTAKLLTYKHMIERNISTFSAQAELYHRSDLRCYGSAALILADLGIKRLRLISNNPAKKIVLEEKGFEIVETLGIVSSRLDIRQYLTTKRDEQGHLINFAIEAVQQDAGED